MKCHSRTLNPRPLLRACEWWQLDCYRRKGEVKNLGIPWKYQFESVTVGRYRPTAHSSERNMEKEKWEKKYNEFWKPLLTTRGKFDEKKIKNELHDLDFVLEQIGEIYCSLTGGRLSKPMYEAKTILGEHDALFWEKNVVGDDIKMLIDGSETKEELVAGLREYFEI